MNFDSSSISFFHVFSYRCFYAWKAWLLAWLSISYLYMTKTQHKRFHFKLIVVFRVCKNMHCNLGQITRITRLPNKLKKKKMKRKPWWRRFCPFEANVEHYTHLHLFFLFYTNAVIQLLFVGEKQFVSNFIMLECYFHLYVYCITLHCHIVQVS